MAIPSLLTHEAQSVFPTSIPIGMDTQRAKQLFKAWIKEKKYVECKQLLLNMIGNGNGNDDHKLLSKLADICIVIGEYQNAERYYIQSISRHAHDASIYAKYGNLLHQYLNNDIKAQTMYNRSIGIDPNNDNCWFNYGKLLFKMGKYAQAEQCYKTCVTERACIHYHYALLLLSYKPSETSRIKLLFHKATEIQPNVVQYHYKYAQYLATIHLRNEANHEYHKAAVLSRYSDVLILFDFAKFSYQYLRDYETAKRLLQTALKLEDAKKYEDVESYYLEIIRNETTSEQKYVQNESEYAYSDESNRNVQNEYNEAPYWDEGPRDRNKKRKMVTHKKKGRRNEDINTNINHNNENAHVARGRGRGGVMYRWKPKPKPNGMKILDNLPVRLIDNQDANKNVDCRICMERFEIGDKVKTLPCFHWQFHVVCIAQWLKDNQSCPICLHVVTKVE